MKIFFMGTTKFSYQCFQTVIRSGNKIVGCAYVDKIFKISYAPTGVKNINYANFLEIARDLNIPCIPYQRNNIKAFIQQVTELAPDLILVAGWYYLVPRELRDIAPKGAIGLHGSLLPKYRGGAPLVWSIINGEKEGGISMFYLDDGVDTGDIIGQKTFSIKDDETIADVLIKLNKAAEQLLEEFLPLLAQDKAPRITQNHAEATVYPQRRPEDGKIDWSQSAKQIRDFIRAQTRPYPGAFTKIAGKKVIIWDASIFDEEELAE
jgi:methionyl-tRNA formyltransferase